MGLDGASVVELQEKSINMSSSTSLANSPLEQGPQSPGNITIVGRFLYVNENGGYSPGRHVLVKFYDAEAGTDEYLGYDYTDDNGNFSFTCNNDDGWLQDGRDIYVKIYAYNNAAKATTDGGSQYVGKTGTKSDVPDGTVDFGTLVPTVYNEAWQAVDAAWSERVWIDGQVGWTRSQVTIKWPSGTWPSYTWTYNSSTGEIVSQYMKLPNKSTASWDHVTVHHGYAHAVMIEAYGTNHFNLPPTTYSASHWVSKETDEGFAILEGWAEFMQSVVDNDADNLQDYGQNIETNDWYNKQDSGDFDGDIIEGSFASILWDIFDPANDDSLNMGFDEIWTIMLNDRPGSIHAIWDSWFARGYNYLSAMNAIFWEHGIDKAISYSITLLETIAAADSTAKGDRKPLSELVFVWTTRSIAPGKSLSELFGLGDSFDREASYHRSLSELFGLGDSFDREASYHRSLSELFGLADSFNRKAGYHRSLSELFGLADSFNREVGYYRSLGEGMLAMDSLSKGFYKPLAEEWATIDSQFKGIDIPLSEAYAGGDSLDRKAEYHRSLSGLFGLGDSFDRQAKYYRSVSEPAKLSSSFSKKISSPSIWEELFPWGYLTVIGFIIFLIIAFRLDRRLGRR